MKWWVKKEYFHTYSDTFPLVFQIVNIKLRANGRIIFDQQLPTLFGVTCWVRLQTLLHVVAQSLKPVKFLAPCKRTQHCRPTIPNVVGGTACNRVRNRTQHVTSNDVWSCWRTMFRPFSRGFRGLWFEFNSSSYHCQGEWKRGVRLCSSYSIWTFFNSGVMRTPAVDKRSRIFYLEDSKSC